MDETSTMRRKIKHEGELAMFLARLVHDDRMIELVHDALYETYHMTFARSEAWCMSVAKSVLEAAPAVRWVHMIPAMPHAAPALTPRLPWQGLVPGSGWPGSA